MRYVWIGIVLAGCYSPKYRDCEVSCATGAGCPSDLTCDNSNQRCRVSGMVGATCSVTDIDASMIDAPTSPCWHGVTPTNFMPCDNGFPVAGSFSLTTNSVFDTDGGTLDSVPLGQKYVFQTSEMWLVHVDALVVPSGTNLRISGLRTLLVVSDGAVDISGTVDGGRDIGNLADCDSVLALAGTASGPGGGGGGGGTVGGTSGEGSDLTGAIVMGGGARGVASLSPLHPGCPGGRGGNGGSPAQGGSAGYGGAAIEIASAVSIAITGRLTVGGSGGLPGSATASGCGGACASGGGGGGAGGELLVEAPSITIPASGSLCATGGGGGEGADSTTIMATQGANGLCVAAAGGDSGGAQGGGNGGAGGAFGPGGTGLDGVTTGGLSGGGGGGGGAGRIRIHATTHTTSGTIAPVPLIQ